MLFRSRLFDLAREERVPVTSNEVLQWIAQPSINVVQSNTFISSKYLIMKIIIAAALTSTLAIWWKNQIGKESSTSEQQIPRQSETQNPVTIAADTSTLQSSTKTKTDNKQFADTHSTKNSVRIESTKSAEINPPKILYTPISVPNKKELPENEAVIPEKNNVSIPTQLPVVPEIGRAHV